MGGAAPHPGGPADAGPGGRGRDRLRGGRRRAALPLRWLRRLPDQADRRADVLHIHQVVLPGSLSRGGAETVSGGARAPFAVLVDRSAYKAVAARWAARNFVGGGVGSALLAVFILIFYGRPDGFRPMGIFVLGAGFVACGLLFPLLFRRSLTAGMTASGALTALAVAGYTAGVGRHLAAAVAGAAVMVAASAPILYPRRWAICILAGELATTGLVLATEPHYTAAANRIILLILQTSLFAVLIIWFASTLTGLAARERQARAETERTRAELLGVDDRRRNFLHQMSHELRTPLNAIIGFAEMVHLGMAGPLEERQQQYLEPIIASGRHP